MNRGICHEDMSVVPSLDIIYPKVLLAEEAKTGVRKAGDALVRLCQRKTDHEG